MTRGRKRTSGIQLPTHVHKVTVRGKDYFYYQTGRSTAKQSRRIRIPHEPQSPDFWTFIAKLQKADKEPQNNPDSVKALVKAYQSSSAYKVLSDSSKRDYDRYLTLLEKRLGKFPARAINVRVMVELQDSLADKPSTANHAVSVFRTVFKWGIPRGFVKANPCDGLEKLKTKTKRAKPWPDEIVNLAVDHARWEIRTFVLLGLYTGQRTGDILRMTLHDIKGNSIKVIQSKTGKELWIPLHKHLAPVIDECRKRGSIILVPRHDGTPLDANGFRAMFTREMGKGKTKRIRAEGYNPHGLRASAASRLKEIGCSSGQISSITGMSAAMVEYYTSQYDQRKTAQEVIALWEKSEK